MRAYCSDHR
jgi:hypothetical protein